MCTNQPCGTYLVCLGYSLGLLPNKPGTGECRFQIHETSTAKQTIHLVPLRHHTDSHLQTLIYLTLHLQTTILQMKISLDNDYIHSVGPEAIVVRIQTTLPLLTSSYFRGRSLTYDQLQQSCCSVPRSGFCHVQSCSRNDRLCNSKEGVLSSYILLS